MDQFKKKFIEEASDLIHELEYSLLKLEDDPFDTSMVEQVFRAMHTVKGNSAMFGFSQIDRFTHNLETVYDLVRNGKIPVTSALLTLSLEAVDHLKILLVKGDEVDGTIEEESALLTNRINRFIKNEDEVALVEVVAEPALNELEDGFASEGVATYHIYFKPHDDVFCSGTNPLYLIDELCSMGQSVAFADTSSIPELNLLKEDCCYTAWNIFLATSATISELHDVFIFVEDSCELEISEVATCNLIKNEAFYAKLHEIELIGGMFSLAELKSYSVSLLDVEKDADNMQRNSKKSAVKETAITSIRVSSDKVDGLMNLVSELITIQAQLSLFAEKNLLPELSTISENMEKVSRRLRDTAFSICLIPLDSMLTRFHRLVRDVSTELGKNVTFLTEGADAELDKTMIESLADPIMHILRNSLDHGIETEAVRTAKGKLAQGTIRLKAFYSGTNVIIQISDDGKGINPEHIREKAIQQNIIGADTILSQQELLDLIFLPGFSTAEKVTDLSGRGVGMDVVKRKLAEIRGEVEINSEQEKGTTITIKLPLTLSIIDGLLVKIADTFFVVPLSAVDTIFAANHSELIGYNNLIVHAGSQIPYVCLRNVLDYPENEDTQEQVVVVSYLDSKVGLVIDRVVGEYQAVLKPLGKSFKELDIVSGASILGDGTIALVLDVSRIIKLASGKSGL